MIYRITGGGELWGRISPQGSKNAALPLLFAVLLTGEATLSRLPHIGDVRSVLFALRDMGAHITEQGEDIHISAYTLRPPSEAAQKELGKTRAAAYLLGAGLGRFGEVTVPRPGGCDLGGRPLDLHRAGLMALGAEWEETESGIRVRAHKLRGGRVILPYPSVGATVNLLFAALAAEGESEIRGYAKERHILDVVRALCASGADITAEADALRVRGGERLSPIRHTVMADGIETGTYLIATAAAGGDLRVTGEVGEELSPLLSLLTRMGCEITEAAGELRLRSRGCPTGADVVCAPYPAIPTDLHPQLAVLLSRAATGGHIRDRVFRERYAYLTALSPLGFRGAREDEGARILPARLFGATVTAPDLRAGAAAVLAAHLATGDSRILRAERVERGYERLPEKCRAIGMDIREEQR